MHYIVKLTNATVIGLSEAKLDNTVLSIELEIEGYDLLRSDRSRRGGGVACFVKNSISYNGKPNFCINTESIFIKIFLLKSKPVLIIIDIIIIITIIVIIIIIIIIIINIYSGSIYKYNGSFPYKLKKYINKRIKTVKITYKVYVINIRAP